MKRSTCFALVLVTLLLLPSCRGNTIAIEVPRGFTGQLHVICGMRTGFPYAAIQVDASGTGMVQECPREDVPVTVYRAGDVVEHGAVVWDRTGDKIALDFTLTGK